MRKFNWGIIGPGNIARTFFADLILVKDSLNSVIAVMSDDLSDAEDFSKMHDVPFYFNNLQDMFDTAKPDIIYIASPHSAHYKACIACLQHHVPVLCEKPLALNSIQANAMITASHTSHTFLMEGLWIRFLPSIQQVLKLVAEGAIGKITSIVADMSYLAPKDEENRFYDPEQGGGSLLDLGIYPVYLSLLILGIPEHIKATARLNKGHIDESCAVILEYKNSVYALLESSIIKETNKRAYIYGEKGCIIIQEPWNEKPAGMNLTWYDRSNSPHKPDKQNYSFNWPGRGFQYEVAAVEKCIVANQLECKLHAHSDSLKLISLLDEIRVQTGIIYPTDEQETPVTKT